MKRLYIIYVGCLWVLLAASSGVATGQTMLPLNRLMQQRIERQVYLNKFPALSPFRAYSIQKLNESFNVDSTLRFNEKHHKTWLGRKLCDESFIQIDSTDFTLHADPVFNFQAGKDRYSSNLLYVNTRGGTVTGTLGKKFAFASWFYEDQGRFPQYWDTLINRVRVSPGQGRAKRYNKTGWDYAYSGGYISWDALKNLNFQFGNSKQFIGNGYRSLLLSDVSTGYPFFKIDWRYKHFQYVKMITSFTNFYYPFMDVREFYKKTGTLQFINVQVGKKVQLAIFEMNIWANPDSSGKFKWDARLLNPLPFVLSIKDDNPELYNTLNGINLSYNPFKGLVLYSQFVVDERSRNGALFNFKKYGYQLGWKLFDPFRIKNLYLQGELNQVQPYTYSHSTPFLAYSNFQQPLAHPLGANFREWVGIINYRYKSWFVEIKGTKAMYGGDDKNSNWGKNIFKPSDSQVSDSKLFQGVKTDLFTTSGELSYYINPKTNMNLTAGVYIRDEKAATFHSQIQQVYFSFRTSLTNLYYDF